MAFVCWTVVLAALQPPQPLQRVSRRLVIIGTAVTATPSCAYEQTACDRNPAKCRSASYGEGAQLSLFGGLSGGDEADAVARNQLGSATGPKSYASSFDAMDEMDRASLLARVDATAMRWYKMKAEVTKALSASTPAYPVAQSVLDGSMNQLKTDMRTVSKALSGGDITVRPSPSTITLTLTSHLSPITLHPHPHPHPHPSPHP